MIFSPLVSLLLLAQGSNALAPRQYLPHAVQPPIFQTAASVEGDNWSVKEQDDSVCAAGSRHFAGRINVTDDKSMFFWFFESRNEEPRNDPVVIWLNGGPGASSLTGLYTEVGPCFINPDGQGTTKSGASWTEHANVLFIDQPAGVGLSTLANETEYPHNLATSSRDFLALLKIFYSEIFPQHDHNDLYIAGESYGGRFAPYYSAAILREQLEGSAGALQHVPLKGMVLVNAMVGSTWTSQGHYEMFCTDVPPNLVRFNDTTCRAMAAALPECERLSALCTTSLEPRVCEAAGMFCIENIYKYFDAEVQAHRRSTYDLRKDCPDPPLCGVGQNSSYGETSDFLNRRDVQKQLGFEQPVDFVSINFDINMRFSLDPQIWVPTTPEVTYLLNGGVTGPAGQADLNRSVSVLVLNGEYDVGCNQPAAIREYDSQPWHLQAAYRAVTELKPWYWLASGGEAILGGYWKGAPQPERGLELVTVKDAGHMAPGDQRAAVASIFGRWVSNGGLLGQGSLDPRENNEWENQEL